MEFEPSRHEDCKELVIFSAQYVQQVLGRKTDEADAEWLAKLMRYGLLAKSFIPDVEQRDLRDLTRYRTRLTAERSSAVNRLEKILEDANIKLSSVASDIQGVSARAILDALIAGESDAEAMSELAHGGHLFSGQLSMPPPTADGRTAAPRGMKGPRRRVLNRRRRWRRRKADG
jgi:hypothetical protein